MSEQPIFDSFDGLMPFPVDHRMTESTDVSADDVGPDASAETPRVSVLAQADGERANTSIDAEEMDVEAKEDRVAAEDRTNAVNREQDRRRSNDTPILNPPSDAHEPAMPVDLSYVGILDLTLGENWNCGSFIWSAPLLGQDFQSFPEPDAEQQDSEDLESEEIEQDVSLTEGESDVIERLAEWLIDVRAAADEVAGLESVVGDPDTESRFRFDTVSDDEPPNPGLFRLVEEFTSLRQDVKLQAKSARGLQEQAASLLDGLNRAIEQFQSVAPREQLVARDAVKPLLESLTDLDAALDRGRLAAETARARLLDEKSDHWRELVDAQWQAIPIWKRWFARQFSADLAKTLQARFTESWSASQNAQVEGYRLVQNRLRRLLQQQKVERIETTGRLADPNLMTVVDVADREDLPAGTVLEELRPGYVWQGQLLRYAEVRVVRSRGEK